jgi:hypothetical protein
MDSIIYQLQTSFLLNKPTTGLWVLDMVLIPLGIGFMFNIFSSKVGYFKMFKQWLKSLFLTESKFCAKIDFEGTIIRCSWKTRVELDIGMIAIFHHIFNNLSNIQGIQHFKRIPDKALQSEFIEQEHKTSCQKLSLNLFEEFFIIQDSKVTIEDGLFIIPNVYDDEPVGTKENKVSKTTSYNITLVCDKYESIDKNMKYLLQFYRKICVDYNEFKEKDKDNNRYIYTYDNTSEQTVYFNRFCITKEPKTIEHIFFPNKNEFLRDMDFFFANKDFYIRKGKPYRKIILSHGEPGCGKTSLLLALLEYTSRIENRHLIHLKLDKLTRKDLFNILFKETIKVNDLFEGSKKIPFHQRIYCIEEIDNYSASHKRNNTTGVNTDKNKLKEEIMKELNIPADKISLLQGPDKSSDKQNDMFVGIQDLLEAFDGIPSMKSGEIVYMTTNHIDKIDSALKRPGRVNHLMEFKKCTTDTVVNIMEHYYESIFPEDLQSKLKDDYWSPAYIESICDSSDTIENAIHLLYSKT